MRADRELAVAERVGQRIARCRVLLECHVGGDVAFAVLVPEVPEAQAVGVGDLRLADRVRAPLQAGTIGVSISNSPTCDGWIAGTPTNRATRPGSSRPYCVNSSWSRSMNHFFVSGQSG